MKCAKINFRSDILLSLLNVYRLLQLFFPQLLTENIIYRRDFHLHLKKSMLNNSKCSKKKVYAPFIIENPHKQYSLNHHACLRTSRNTDTIS